MVRTASPSARSASCALVLGVYPAPAIVGDGPVEKLFDFSARGVLARGRRHVGPAPIAVAASGGGGGHEACQRAVYVRGLAREPAGTERRRLGFEHGDRIIRTVRSGNQCPLAGDDPGGEVEARTLSASTGLIQCGGRLGQAADASKDGSPGERRHSQPVPVGERKHSGCRRGSAIVPVERAVEAYGHAQPRGGRVRLPEVVEDRRQVAPQIPFGTGGVGDELPVRMVDRDVSGGDGRRGFLHVVGQLLDLNREFRAPPAPPGDRTRRGSRRCHRTSGPPPDGRPTRSRPCPRDPPSRQ